MKYVMVTGTYGAGKSTLLRSLPGARDRFVPPPGVPEMMQESAYALGELQLYELDAPTARGVAWRSWLAAAHLFVVVVDGREPVDDNARQLWAHLAAVAPATPRLLVVNHAPAGGGFFAAATDLAAAENLAAAAVLPVRAGARLNEERAVAPDDDLRALLAGLLRLLGLPDDDYLKEQQDGA